MMVVVIMMVVMVMVIMINDDGSININITVSQLFVVHIIFTSHYNDHHCPVTFMFTFQN